MLALDRAVRAGLDVRWLVNLYDADSNRIRFHGVRRQLIEMQADRLGRVLIQLPTKPDTFESVFHDALDRIILAGARGIIFGNIHLDDVRAWYETRTTAAGLIHTEPLWSESPDTVVAEVIERGHDAIVVGVDTGRGRREWLGRHLDATMLHELATMPEVDTAGERGEYHTFVRDGPMFRSPIDVMTGTIRDSEGHAMIDLVPV